MLPDQIPTSQADCEMMMHVKTANGQRREQQEEEKNTAPCCSESSLCIKVSCQIVLRHVCPLLSRSLAWLLIYTV